MWCVCEECVGGMSVGCVRGVGCSRVTNIQMRYCKQTQSCQNLFENMPNIPDTITSI